MTRFNLLLFPIILILHREILVRGAEGTTDSTNTGYPKGCKPCKQVLDGPEHLKGTYTLDKTPKKGPRQDCKDDCVYTKDGQDYCFRAGPYDVESCGAIIQGGSIQGAVLDTSCKCGVKGGKSRIVGGAPAERFEWPWMAVWGQKDGGWGGCGGTLISDKWVLTAAHCFFNQSSPTKELIVTTDTNSIFLGYGANLKEPGPNKKEFRLRNIFIHPSNIPKYNGLGYDITLMELEEPADLGIYTPACLPTKDQDFTGQKGWVYGHGTVSPEQEISSTLLELEEEVRTPEYCKNAYKNLTNWVWNWGPSQICAGGNNKPDQPSACHGDSGGPFTVPDENGIHTLAGDVSWSTCGAQGEPDAYGNVAYFRDWIDKIIGENGGGTFCAK